MKTYIYKNLWIGLLVLILMTLGLAFSSSPVKARSVAGSLLIDDFNDLAVSRLGTHWELATESPRGALQLVQPTFQRDQDQSCLVLRPQKKTLIARLALVRRSGYFDARRYQGVAMKIRGSGSAFLDLSTRDGRHRHQYYRVIFNANDTWQTVRLPFTDFKAMGLQVPLDKTGLRQLSVRVTPDHSGQEVWIDELSFYGNNIMLRDLTPQERHVIIDKGTEPPFTGKYTDYFHPGTYTCKQCGTPLFHSDTKFHSGCGWPSFDQSIPGDVKLQPDADGARTEVVCAKCGAHLGHVFYGEGFTAKNTRFCINSIALDFIPAYAAGTRRAIFAGGCFWGVEYYLGVAPGVIKATVGYTGGHVPHPTYQQVCTGRTGHAEAVEVIFDPNVTSFTKLAKLFFEIHDFTQLNRQGPDVGNQYRSAIFTVNEQQKTEAEALIQILKDKGYDVKTEVTPAGPFWPAEKYHQDYYKKNGKHPYCHIRRKIF